MKIKFILIIPFVLLNVYYFNILPSFTVFKREVPDNGQSNEQDGIGIQTVEYF